MHYNWPELIMQLLVRYDYTFCHCDFDFDFNAVKNYLKDNV